MLTMDPLAVIISGIFLIGGIIGMVKFISERPTRKEMYESIDRVMKPINEELQYQHKRLDDIYDALPKRRTK